MGDPSKEVTEEDRDEAVAAKAKAMEAMAEGEHGIAKYGYKAMTHSSNAARLKQYNASGRLTASINHSFCLF
jgi:hypothetical protein